MANYFVTNYTKEKIQKNVASEFDRKFGQFKEHPTLQIAIPQHIKSVLNKSFGIDKEQYQQTIEDNWEPEKVEVEKNKDKLEDLKWNIDFKQHQK